MYAVNVTCLMEREVHQRGEDVHGAEAPGGGGKPAVLLRSLVVCLGVADLVGRIQRICVVSRIQRICVVGRIQVHNTKRRRQRFKASLRTEWSWNTAYAVYTVYAWSR
jgi:hypothetical protein